MKRIIAITVAFLASVACASAREYSFLNPPTLAVADFEVSMSAAEKEAGKLFYGQLVSQALLTVLVQQNAASVVYAPKESGAAPGTPVYSPDAAVTVAVDNGAQVSFATVFQKAAQDYAKAKNDDERIKAVNDAVKASAAATAGVHGIEEAARDGKNQIARLYLPSIFKIYDKKYVETALQNGLFTVKDLYGRNAGAFSLMDLDFLVLGNVYETRHGDKNYIGINVRVLSTQRAEEVFSYMAIVDHELRDLPVACAQIGRRIMMDLLDSSCAQVAFTESDEVTGISTPSTDDGGGQGSQAMLGTAENQFKYQLFWQPLQVKKDDNTIGYSDESDIREVQKDIFYWMLPGQYVLSVYNKEARRVKAITQTIDARAVKSIVIEKGYLEVSNGSITIAEIAPTTNYSFSFRSRKQEEQHWWEIFLGEGVQNTFKVGFHNGEVEPGNDNPAEKKGTQEKKAGGLNVEYRPETQDILIQNVPPGDYEVTATREPSDSLSGITGLWETSTNLAIQSEPLKATVRDLKDERIPLSRFNLQETRQLESPQKNLVTFILKPGFGYAGWIQINDGSPRTSAKVNWIDWRDKEKIVVKTEYSKSDWDTFPDVTYTVYTYVYSKDFKYYFWEYEQAVYRKKDITPDRDVIHITDLEKLSAKAQIRADAYNKRVEAEKAAAAAKLPAQATQKTTTTTPQATAAPTVPALNAAGKTYLKLAAGPGFGAYQSSYYNSSTRTTSYYSVGAFTLSAAAQLYWPLSPVFGLGVGGFFDGIIGSGIGVAGTMGMMFGDLTKSTAITLDVGIGTGFTVGAGLAFPGGLSVGVDYFLPFSPSGSYSLTAEIGYMIRL